MPTLHVGIRIIYINNIIMPEHNCLTISQDYAKYYAGIIRQGLLTILQCEPSVQSSEDVLLLRFILVFMSN